MQQLKNFINGEFVSPLKGNYLDNRNPATDEIIGQVASSTSEDVDLAVQSAQLAFVAWSATTVQERSDWLYKIADAVERHIDELAELESVDQGKPVHLAKNMDMKRVVLNFRFFAGSILHAENEATESSLDTGMDTILNYTLRKPIGVAGLISPWNLPLYLLSWKLAPALACGNTVVAKPSEFTSLTAGKFCQLLQQINFPKGVINMIFGTGNGCGEALVRHPKVPLISFTGGTETGRKVIEASALYTKKISLELGGKNPNLIFADCNYSEMLKTSLRSSFLNQGEICLCGSRIYVEENIYDRFISDFVAAAKALKVGDPRDPNTFMGPLVSRSHYEKVLSVIARARADGGQVLCGGAAVENLPVAFSKGYFIAPTVIIGLPETSSCVQEEIFGPVVTMGKFKDTNDAIQKANGVKYGLSASVWTQDISRAHRLGKQLNVGTVWLNSWMVRDLRVPFGGMKSSGLGREGGKHSLDFYSETTTVCLKY